MLQTRIPVFAAMLAVFGLVGLLQPAQALAEPKHFVYGALEFTETSEGSGMYETNVPGTEGLSFALDEGTYELQTVFTSRIEMSAVLSVIPGANDLFDSLSKILGPVIEIPEFAEFQITRSPTM